MSKLWLRHAVFTIAKFTPTFTRCSLEVQDCWGAWLNESRRRLGWRRATAQFQAVALIKTLEFGRFRLFNGIAIVLTLGLKPKLLPDDPSNPFRRDFLLVLRAMPVHEPACDVLDR